MTAITVDASISEELAGILRKVANTPQELADWIAAENLVEPADVGALCKDEEKVATIITNCLENQAGLRLKHKSAVVRVWWMCRASMSKQEGVASGRIRTDDAGPLEPEVSDPCHQAWTAHCGYRILSCKLLIETTLKSLYNELNMKPRRLTVRLAENLRTQTCIDRAEASALVFRAGQAPTKTVDVNDEVTDKYNLWMRIRAWLFSISFLMIADRSFLSPAKAEAYSEILLELMHQRFDGSPAPLSHYITAYLQSARIWVEAVRDGKTLETALGEEATWRHLWSTYARPMASTPERPAKPSTPANSGPDVSGNLQKEIENLKKQNKQYQSERDVALNRLKGSNGKAKDAEDEDADARKRRRVAVSLRPNRRK